MTAIEPNFDFEKALKKLRSAENSYAKALQTVCVYSLIQMHDHGNWDYINRVRETVRLNATKNAVDRWAVVHSPTVLDGGKLRKDRERAENENAFMLEEAQIQEVATFKQPKAQESLSLEDMEKRVAKIIDFFTKTKDKDDIDDEIKAAIEAAMPSLQSAQDALKGEAVAA